MHTAKMQSKLFRTLFVVETTRIIRRNNASTNGTQRMRISVLFTVSLSNIRAGMPEKVV